MQRNSAQNTTYAIETIGLTKKYPAARDNGNGGGRGRGVAISSLEGVKGLFHKERTYTEALRGIDMQVKHGEIIGLLGPNGAGKTTLIKILCTLVIHDEGIARVNGFDVKKEPSQVVKNLQAVLPESRGFNWRLSGRQNLQFYALLYGIPDREANRQIDHLLNLTGLTKRADDGYQRYSTGMQRRLLLCRALLRNTPILLFDEPTSGLDPTAAADFRSLVKDTLAGKEGTTILLSTHNLSEAQEICDRIAIMDKGKIIAFDTPSNIQYAIQEEKIINFVLRNVLLSAETEAAISKIMGIQGIKGISKSEDATNHLSKLSIRVDKDMPIFPILDVMADANFKIESIDTSELSLEDAFMRITRQREPTE